MTHYEYMVKPLPAPTELHAAENTERMLYKAGESGWRLHTFAPLLAIFERERQEVPVEKETTEERAEETGSSGDVSEGRQEAVPDLPDEGDEKSDQVPADGAGGQEVEDPGVRAVLPEGTPEPAVPKRNEILCYKLSFPASSPNDIPKKDGPISTPCDVFFPGFAIGKTVCEKETPFHVIVKKPAGKVWGGVLGGQIYHSPEIALYRKIDGIGQVYYGDLINVWQVCEIPYSRAERKMAYAEMKVSLAAAEEAAMGETVVEKLFERMDLDEDDDLGNWFYSGPEAVAVLIGMETMTEAKESRTHKGFEIAPGPRQDYRDDEYDYNRVVDTMGGTLYHRRPR